MAGYQPRQAAYDLRKLRGKALVERIGGTRGYRVRRPGIRTLAGLLILREKALKPVLAPLTPSAVVHQKTFIRWMSITRSSNAKCWPPCKL